MVRQRWPLLHGESGVGGALLHGEIEDEEPLLHGETGAIVTCSHKGGHCYILNQREPLLHGESEKAIVTW